MLKTVQNISGNSGLTLLRRQNLDCPVRSDLKRICNFTAIPLDPQLAIAYSPDPRFVATGRDQAGLWVLENFTDLTFSSHIEHVNAIAIGRPHTIFLEVLMLDAHQAKIEV